jgi:hypothetical protein
MIWKSKASNPAMTEKGSLALTDRKMSFITIIMKSALFIQGETPRNRLTHM